MLKFYVGENLPLQREIKPWNIVNDEFSVSGIYNKEKNIVAFYGEKELGNIVTNDRGQFTIKTNYRLPSNATIKFYIK